MRLILTILIIVLWIIQLYIGSAILRYNPEWFWVIITLPLGGWLMLGALALIYFGIFSQRKLLVFSCSLPSILFAIAGLFMDNNEPIRIVQGDIQWNFSPKPPTIDESTVSTNIVYDASSLNLKWEIGDHSNKRYSVEPFILWYIPKEFLSDDIMTFFTFLSGIKFSDPINENCGSLNHRCLSLDYFVDRYNTWWKCLKNGLYYSNGFKKEIAFVETPQGTSMILKKSKEDGSNTFGKVITLEELESLASNSPWVTYATWGINIRDLLTGLENSYVYKLEMPTNFWGYFVQLLKKYPVCK